MINEQVLTKHDCYYEGKTEGQFIFQRRNY